MSKERQKIQRQELMVICGANTQKLRGLQRMTVGELRSRLIEVMNIPASSQTLIDGMTVGDNHVIALGECRQIEFIRPAGSKG